MKWKDLTGLSLENIQKIIEVENEVVLFRGGAS